MITRERTLFHPLHPAPCFLYGWAGDQAIEAIYRALADALPEAVPACSGGDICALVWWGEREETGEPWTDGAPHPVGQGAHAGGDGASSLMHVSEAATRITPVEVWEAKNPWLVERFELAPDSCGPGRQRGGLGLDIDFTMREDAFAHVDRRAHEERAVGAWRAAARRGRTASPWNCRTARRRTSARSPACPCRAARRCGCDTGGGGGYGDPAERDAAAVHADIRAGYISEAHARLHYPHAFEDGA